MSLVLHHNPRSRAATVVWMLEEVGQPYTLSHVDLAAGEQKQPTFLDLNPMGKVPVLVDGDVVVTETPAIGLYLADRYALGRLAPEPSDPARGPYLRWAMFGAIVAEPGAMARRQQWTFNAGTAGWGDWDAMHAALESALAPGPWVLGDRFSMADVALGGTLRSLVGFKMLDARPAFVDYLARLAERPAFQRADAVNAGR